MKVGDRVMTPHGKGTIVHIGRQPYDPKGWYNKKMPYSVNLDEMWHFHYNWSYSKAELKIIPK